MKACVWIPTGPHWSLSRLVSSLTTARFEFTTVDSLIGSNHRPLDRRTRSDRRGRAGRPLRRGSGGSACAAPGLPVTSFLFRCSVNLPQVVDRNPNAGVQRRLEPDRHCGGLLFRIHTCRIEPEDVKPHRKITAQTRQSALAAAVYLCSDGRRWQISSQDARATGPVTPRGFKEPQQESSLAPQSRSAARLPSRRDCC